MKTGHKDIVIGDKIKNRRKSISLVGPEVCGITAYTDIEGAHIRMTGSDGNTDDGERDIRIIRTGNTC
jgi:hypothetical protein